MSILGRILAHICVPDRSLRVVNDEDNLAAYCAWLRQTSATRAEESECRQANARALASAELVERHIAKRAVVLSQRTEAIRLELLRLA